MTAIKRLAGGLTVALLVASTGAAARGHGDSRIRASLGVPATQQLAILDHDTGAFAAPDADSRDA